VCAGILEDELAKGLDAAWRLNLDRTLDAASERLESALSFAAGTPLGNTAVLQWLQQQAQQNHSSGQSNSSNVSSSPASSSRSSGASSSSSADTAPDLIESLLNLPRLAGEDDHMQVDGLQRLAVQLAAFSNPPSSNQQQQQQQQQLTPQQEANSAALQQVRQAALVLQWFASEVQLLSPEAQREALAIPTRILSKFGSRLAARAVRSVLTAPSRPRVITALATPAVRSSARLGSASAQATAPAAVALKPASAAAGQAAVWAEAGVSSEIIVTAVPSGSSEGSGSNSSGGARPEAANAPADATPASGQQESQKASQELSSSSSSGSSSSTAGQPPSLLQTGSNGNSGAYGRSTADVPANGRKTPRGGRMLVLTETSIKSSSSDSST